MRLNTGLVIVAAITILSGCVSTSRPADQAGEPALMGQVADDPPASKDPALGLPWSTPSTIIPRSAGAAEGSEPSSVRVERSFVLRVVDAGAMRLGLTQECVHLDLRNSYMWSGTVTARPEGGITSGGINWTLDVGPGLFGAAKRLEGRTPLPLVEMRIPQDISFTRSEFFLEVPPDTHAASAIDVNVTFSITTSGQYAGVEQGACS